jgi:hypothetical protein
MKLAITYLLLVTLCAISTRADEQAPDITGLEKEFFASKGVKPDDPNRWKLRQTDQFVAFMRDHGVECRSQAKPPALTPELMRQAKPIITDEQIAKLRETLNTQNGLTAIDPADPRYMKALPSLSPWRFATFLNFGNKSAPIPTKALIYVPATLQNLLRRTPKFSLTNLQDMPTRILDSVVLLELRRNSQGSYEVPSDQLEQAKATGKIVIATVGGQPTCPL